MIGFEAQTYQNEYLAVGGSDVSVIVTVTASGTGSSGTSASWAPPTRTAIVIVIDASGSMNKRPRMKSAKQAAAAAIDTLSDGVLFAILRGTEVVSVVYSSPIGLATSTDNTRQAAKQAVNLLHSAGGTAFGQWLLAARHLLLPYDGGVARRVILLTDGHNEHETAEQLDAAIRSCEGIFQCDCRGVGTDWRVDELRTISSRLLGTVDVVAQPENLAHEFAALTSHAMSMRAADVVLRVWTPRGATLRLAKQVSPSVDDLLGRGRRIDDRTMEFPTGAWGDEARDYQFQISVPAQEIGSEMLAGRVSLVVDAEVRSQSLVKAIWTDDEAMSTRINPQVAHFTGQAELAEAIADGLDARKAGDEATALVRFGRAVQLATEAGHHDTLRLLAGVVDVVDADHGTVRLKRHVDDADEMALDARSTLTVRTRKPES